MDDPVLFWTKVAAIGQAVGAIATFGAVVVSLWVVFSERRPSIKLRVHLNMIIGAGDAAMDVVSFDVINAGQRVVHVRSVGWRTGWTQFGPKWLRYQYAYQIAGGLPVSKTPPFELSPGESGCVIVTAQEFHDGGALERDKLFFLRRMPVFNKLISANIHASVSLAEGTTVLSKVDKKLSNFLTSGQIDGGAKRFNDTADDNEPVVAR